MKRKLCIARTDGDFRGSYPCAKLAQAGSEYCYWHDPETLAERTKRINAAMRDRRLEREDREACIRRMREQG